MSFKKLLDRQNKIHVKILLPFLCLIFLFAIAEIVVSNKRISKNIEVETVKLLQNHARLLNEVTKEQEEKVAFYARFMADVAKLSDHLTDTSAGRSILIYLLESLKKDRIRIHLYRELPLPQEKERLIRKGLLGIRTISLVEEKADGKVGLGIAAVAPIERPSGIREVIIAEYPLDHQFLNSLKRKTGADIAVIHNRKVISSTLSPSFQSRSFINILNGEVQNDVLNRGRMVVEEIPDKDDPQKIAFSPISINFENQGVYAVSVSLKQVLINKRNFLLQTTAIIAVILMGVAVLYYIIVRRLTRPIMELSSASRRVAEGDLAVDIDIRTKDELGDLGASFNRMVDQLRESEGTLKRRMAELSQLYRHVSEERNISKSILDNLTNGVILFDPDQRVVLINPTAERWLGVREEQVKGTQIIGEAEDTSLEPLYLLGSVTATEDMVHCWKYFSCDKEECPAYGSYDLRCWFISGTYCRNEIAEKYPEKPRACQECDVYKVYTSALKRQEEVTVEEIELKKPQHRVLKVSVSPVFDDHGKFLGIITVFNDITKEKEIDRLKTEFVSLVSHELRTPLSSIKAYAEILLKKPDRDSDQQLEFLKIMNEETDRLGRLINDILNITKIEERRLGLERKPVDICEIIDKSASAHQASAQRRNIEIVVNLPRDIPHVLGDEDTLRQVLTNLLGNAIKFSAEGGEIQLSADFSKRRPGSYGEVEVRVKDYGIGIPPEHLEKIFERFYRIDQPFTGDEVGTGLGLYFCRQVVENHGGRIWAESGNGKGSTFVFTMPVAGEGEMLHDPLYGVQASNLLLYPRALRKKISILVVDDEKQIRRFLRYYMEDEGFNVYEADNGLKALELASKTRPTVILLDTVMPGLDGYEVLEGLSKNEATKHIPVIVLSGSEDSKIAMVLGAANYLVKPIARKKLITAVNEILSKVIRN